MIFVCLPKNSCIDVMSTIIEGVILALACRWKMIYGYVHIDM